MALVNVINMTVLDNPTCFLNPFQFEITFECLQELDDDLEWKVLYVGSAHDSQYDQILDEILVGPIPVGLNKFILQADPPNITQLLQQPNITSDDILGVTVVLVTCSYKEREFVRIGYYVNNEYDTGEEDNTGVVGGGSTNTSTSSSNGGDDHDENGVDTTKTPTAAAAATAATTTTTVLPASSEVATTNSMKPSDNNNISSNNNNNENDDSPSSETPTPLPTTRPKISIYDIDFHKVQRQILADKPRVTKFPIPWNSSSTTTTTLPLPQQMPGKPLVPPLLSSTPSTIGTSSTSEDERMIDTE